MHGRSSVERAPSLAACSAGTASGGRDIGKPGWHAGGRGAPRAGALPADTGRARPRPTGLHRVGRFARQGKGPGGLGVARRRSPSGRQCGRRAPEARGFGPHAWAPARGRMRGSRPGRRVGAGGAAAKVWRERQVTRCPERDVLAGSARPASSSRASMTDSSPSLIGRWPTSRRTGTTIRRGPMILMTTATNGTRTTRFEWTNAGGKRHLGPVGVRVGDQVVRGSGRSGSRS